RQAREIGPAQIVSVVVRSDPPGALVRVNKLEKTWTTPCDIADYSLGKGLIDVEVSLAGYQTVRTRTKYDGNDPALLELKLVRAGAPPVEPPPAPVAVPAPRPAVPAAPAVPAVKAEPAAGGTRLKINSANAKIRIQAKAVVTDAEKPGEYFLPNVPPDPVVVEFLDPKTDAVLQSVEFTPPAIAPAAVKPAEPKEAPVADADRVGEVKMVSKTYGVFVKLDPGLALQPGEEILVFREGREVARTRILKITKADPVYPDGAAQVQKEGSIQKGDEVRRQKP
ncbi:MAG: PEGA domain-containing protein, partial [Planctomycetaceae bacterium]|nr:PEGA domain-containing protein [Planctomycetaceae bacterium]